ncbi:hypothetical protein M3667_04475 [Microbacterium sp. P26]|uniref:hypothetical protein n=1 Tax=Microbacterium TaxID=33882 RepID=UPI00203E7EE5|nr:hypothetical protein [Microbacterium sp. P26]MCM3501135.1 hypothetical protein [Microbacterium sp. P26]
MEDALSALNDAIRKPLPDTEEIVKRAGGLREAADKLGIAAVSSAVSTAVAALTNLAMNGAFN